MTRIEKLYAALIEANAAQKEAAQRFEEAEAAAISEAGEPPHCVRDRHSGHAISRERFEKESHWRVDAGPWLGDKHLPPTEDELKTIRQMTEERSRAAREWFDRSDAAEARYRVDELEMAMENAHDRQGRLQDLIIAARATCAQDVALQLEVIRISYPPQYYSDVAAAARIAERALSLSQAA